MWKEYLIESGLKYNKETDEYKKSIGWGRRRRRRKYYFLILFSPSTSLKY